MLNLNCVICSDLFSHNDDVHITPCGHMFHYLCLKQWLERSKSCPQCRNKCTDRSIIRVYFNLANLDVSHIDVGSLQEQVDDAKLQAKIKEKELNKAEMQIKSLKDVQKKCMKTISCLEQKLQQKEFAMLSYSEQLKMLKAEVKVVHDLRKEIKTLKSEIETMGDVSSILKGTTTDAEKLLKNENDPKKLSLLVTILKRELRVCESKKTDLRNMLKVVQTDVRKDIDEKRHQEERISQLESDNYQLNEKIRELEYALETWEKPTTSRRSTSVLDGPRLKPLLTERLTISPTIKESVKKIEDSNSPYLNIKSSSIGLIPLFKRQPGTTTSSTISAGDTTIRRNTTTKMATLKIVSPSKQGKASNGRNSSGAVRKTSASDMNEKYSIFKKPRLGLLSSAASAGAAGFSRPIVGTNFVSNGCGGSVKADPFECRELQSLTDNLNTARPAIRGSGVFTEEIPSHFLNRRLKTGGLRDVMLQK